jgi:hypothetical protein
MGLKVLDGHEQGSGDVGSEFEIKGNGRPRRTTMTTSRTIRVWSALLVAACLAPTTVRGDPSPEYRAGLRRTAELRRQRRQARNARPPVGAIAPWPMPPTLIIRHTAEVHDEVQAFLDLLRH